MDNLREMGRTYSSRAWERFPPPGTYDFPDHVSRRPRTRACRLRPREATLSLERPYIEHNTRERDRLRALVERLDDDALRSKVNDQWTVAGVLGHIAFWDARALVLGEKLERGVPFSPSDAEPEDVDWINDATRPLIHAIAPREVAQLALRLAEATDRRVASLPPDRMYPNDPDSPLNPLRADHRGEHLDEIEAALGRSGPAAT